MRELLISNTQPPIFNRLQTKQLKDLSIEKLVKTSSECCSIELCPNRYLDTESLSKIRNRFVSVTWHTPYDIDSNNVDQIPAIFFIKQLYLQGYNVLLHLAGRNLTKYQVRRILDAVSSYGIKNIFVLQGDPSENKKQKNENCDFPYAADLVKFIRRNYGEFFTIGVAGYPEKHPEAETMEADIEHLKEKVDFGANFIITQASYSYEAFEKFAKLCRNIGISVPVIPGIFIINSFKALTAMSNFCGVFVPGDILDIVKKNENNKDAVENFGVYHAAEIIKKILQNRDLYGFHVFSLNDFQLLKKVLKCLGLYRSHIERPFYLCESSNTISEHY
nr:methylenetetrahydrofolate reductase [Leptinotarsa decemlineata]